MSDESKTQSGESPKATASTSARRYIRPDSPVSQMTEAEKDALAEQMSQALGE